MPAGHWLAFDANGALHDCRVRGADSSPTQTLASAAPPTMIEPVVETPSSPPAATLPRQLLYGLGHSLLTLLLLLLLLRAAPTWFLPTASSPPAVTPLSQSVGAVESSPEPTLTPTPTLLPTLAAEITPRPLEIGVQIEPYPFIHVRFGPDAVYPEVARVYTPEFTFTALGRDERANWIYGFFEDGTTGWIMAEFAEAASALATLPVQPVAELPGVAASVDRQRYDFIYVRSGPGIEFAEVGRVQEPSEPLEALGRTEEGSWVFVRLADGTLGWILGEFVLADGGLDTLPTYLLHEIGTAPLEITPAIP